MNVIRIPLVILVFLVFYGCSGSGVPQGYESPQALAMAYQNYHDAQDIDGLLSLVYSSSGDKELHSSSFADDVQLEITDITIEALEAGALDSWKKRGIEPNIAPVGWLKVTLQVPDNHGAASSYSQYLIGRKDGRYYIASNQ